MLVGEKVTLWALERHDILAVYKWVNDPQISKLAVNWYYPLSLEDVENWYTSIITNPTIKVFSIRLPDGELVGILELTNIDFKNRKAELGIILGEKEHWAKGYGEDALRTILKFSFHELGLNRIGLSVLDYNERAIKLFEKLGFKHEGRLREAYFTDGKFHDIIVMGILADEWQAKVECERA